MAGPLAAAMSSRRGRESGAGSDETLYNLRSARHLFRTSESIRVCGLEFGGNTIRTWTQVPGVSSLIPSDLAPLRRADSFR